MGNTQPSFLIQTENTIQIAPLPTPVRARNNDPATSHAAARSLTNAETLALRLLRCYQDRTEGLTDFEAGRALGVDGAWKRCSELRKNGWIRVLLGAGGKPMTRPGPSNRMQQVCAITVAGYRQLERCGVTAR